MLIPLKLLRDKPLQQQLYEQLHELIVSGRLATGTRMPSTRMLADQFSISRITVLLTYDRLIAESYLRTVPAKGTFVAQIPAADRPHQYPHNCKAGVGGTPEEQPRVGRPDPRLFPIGKWRSLIRTALDHFGESLSEDHPDGDQTLRESITRLLSTSRGLAVDPDQIILANGRQHALHIITHLLLRPGMRPGVRPEMRVVIESPCDTRVEQLIASTGATVVRVPVDDDGLQTDRLPTGPVALALVTPEHQQPSGAVMSLPRRQALLAWAARSGATVIEEDPDGEFRYDSMYVPSLMNLDGDGIVIHAGAFAASLGPGMMLGYLAVPHRLAGPARAAGRLIGDCAGRLERAALANLIDSGGYARHLYHLRKTYLGRRDVLIASLRRNFGERIEVGGIAAGLHLAWTLPPYLGAAASVASLARRFGLDAGWIGERVVLLGFGIPAPPQIETGISRLAATLARVESLTQPLARSRDELNAVLAGD